MMAPHRSATRSSTSARALGQRLREFIQSSLHRHHRHDQGGSLPKAGQPGNSEVHHRQQDQGQTSIQRKVDELVIARNEFAGMKRHRPMDRQAIRTPNTPPGSPRAVDGSGVLVKFDRPYGWMCKEFGPLKTIALGRASGRRPPLQA